MNQPHEFRVSFWPVMSSKDIQMIRAQLQHTAEWGALSS
jgi:hypothetical protein